MKLIPLTHGKFAKVDDEDYDYLMQWAWYTHRSGKHTFYAARKEKINGVYVTIYMHRVIMETPNDLEVDHINGIGYDNQRSNMRNCSTEQNARNRILSEGQDKGLTYVHSRGKYQVQLRTKGVKHWIGYFKTREEAVLAYNEAARKYHGEFAYQNEL